MNLKKRKSVGKSKAEFFRLCGFNETNTSLFEKELLHLEQVLEKIKHSRALFQNKRTDLQ